MSYFIFNQSKNVDIFANTCLIERIGDQRRVRGTGYDETKNFQPVNITFGLLEPLPVELQKKYRNKRERHMVQVERALIDWDNWLAGTQPPSSATVHIQSR